ncbi:YciI family protein [Pseudomonas sp. UL073]|uniref:YciI family protein n=1 Tax=Zestomonas insulae TaxID=2809017 RepID=A0ABS2IJP5_9GAMM|nr:YciI family protein [Pseudomonas insulae]MBM7063286.1 YciI family protein [Pseudomonas insulae]
MKYLCLVYGSEQLMHSQPDSPHDAECNDYCESVRASGRLVAAEALEPVRSATTVRMRGGKLSITDGPFAETKEQLAGFYLIDARDLNEALQLAGKIPAARVGCVEVRPVRQLQV